MGFKKTIKKAWKSVTSEKAKLRYKKTGITLRTGSHKVARYFENTNRALDNIVGTRDPNRGKLAGVKVIKRKSPRKKFKGNRFYYGL